MSAFADSSALVKLYADEAGSDVVRALSELMVSALARVEVPAAIWRKEGAGEIDRPTAGVLVAGFEADLFGLDGPPRFEVIASARSVLDTAAALTGSLSLRAYDAVQLASAIAARDAGVEVDAFACYDDDLRAAAGREGFALSPGRR